MTDFNYPTSIEQIETWSIENRVTTEQGNIRFLAYVILQCIASNPVAREEMIFKGGNALRFAYKSPRSTKDLDFTAEQVGTLDREDAVRKLLDKTLEHAERRFNVNAKCQKVKRNPRDTAKTRPTFDRQKLSITKLFQTTM